MADNETNIGNPSVDVDIIPKVVSLEQLMAQLVRSFAELKPVIYARVAIDRAVTGGVGEQVQRAVDEVANKLRLSFQAIGRADELQTGFRAIESHLQQITADAEKAGQALTMSLKGPSGEGTYTLKGRQGVSEFINRMPQYSAALGPSGAPITAGIGANINPSDANLESVKAIRESTGVITARTKAEQEAEKASKRQQDAGDKLAKWMDLWASGGRPQRALGSALQGPLTSMLGPEMGAMGAGLGAMIGGGALFHIGWAITNELSKIPEQIMQHVAENQAIDVARARMAGQTPAELYNAPAGTTAKTTDADFLATLGAGEQAFNRLDENGKGGEDFQNTLNSLVMQRMGNVTDPQKRAEMFKKLTTITAQAEFGHIEGGMDATATVANALFDMKEHQDAAAMQTILKQPGMKEFMIKRRRAEKHLGKDIGDEQIWAGLQGSLNTEMGSGSAVLRGEAVQTVSSAFENVIASNPNMAAAKTKMRQPQIGKAFWEFIASEVGTKEKMTGTDLYSIKRYGQFRDSGLSAEKATAEMTRLANRGIANYLWEPVVSPEARMKQLLPAAEAARGDFTNMLGGKPAPYKDPLLNQPLSSFSSLAGFADKMQTEAGLQMDYPQRTADAAEQTVKELQNLNTNLSGKNATHVADHPSVHLAN